MRFQGGGRSKEHIISRRRIAGLLGSLIASASLAGGAAADDGSPTDSVAPVSRSSVARAQALRAWTPRAGAIAPMHAGEPQMIKAPGMRTFTLEEGVAENRLDGAPEQLGDGSEITLSLPSPDGGYQRFTMADTEVMAPKLAALHPEVQTYAGQGIDDPGATVRVTTSDLGLQASVRGGELGDWYIDPVYQRDTSMYASYFGADLVNRHGPLIEPAEIADDPVVADRADAATDGISNGSQLRTYRLALLSDPSYATFFGAANVTAAKVALMNRVDQIYEDELAITMTLVGANDNVNLNTDADMTGANGPCGEAACYTTAQAATCSSGTLTRSRIVIGQLIGAGNFQIGHVALGLNGGGIASLGVVGRSAKAQGCTGIPAPVGDFYAVDYVSHEMGHQFSGNHTFNGTQLNCSGTNRNAGTSVEPGSGSSIMAYAGICARDDLQPHSDPYFSQRSFQEIETYTASSQTAINEVQSVALSGFSGTDSFELQYGANTSGPITSGATYVTDLQTALTNILPAGTVATLANFGGGTAPSSSGFQVTFSGTSSGLPASNILQVVNSVGLTTFSSNETDRGGPVTNGGSTSPTGNTPPAVTTPASFTIPYRTPFTLAGSATDTDSDPLTYMWEQNDAGSVAGGTLLTDPAKTSGPLFRQFGTRLDSTAYVPGQYETAGENHTTADPTRTFPDMTQILAGNTNAATGDCPNGPAPASPPVPVGLVDCYSEFLPTAGYAGPMHFRLTARDGRSGGGGVGSADTTVNLAPSTGPFLVTSPNTTVSWDDSRQQTVTWNVAGTDANGVNAANVRISLSADGGLTFPFPVAASTPNDGSAAVQIPDLGTTRARIKVEGLGNVFFDVSDTDFTINDAPGPQIITFPTVAPKHFGAPDVTIAPTASSGLAVTTSADGDCALSGTALHLTGAGSCSVTATQDGDADFEPAPDVTRTFDIAPAITRTSLKVKRKGFRRGHRVRATASVNSGAAGPAGSIVLVYGKRKVGEVEVGADDQAKFKFRAKRTAKLTARFTPVSDDYAASDATTRLRVKRKGR